MAEVEFYEYIAAGERRRSTAERVVACPYDGVPVGRFSYASEEDIEDACRHAAEAFRAAGPPPLFERVAVLSRLATLIGERADELARVLALESGKNVKEARSEVARCRFTCEAAAHEAGRGDGEVVPLDLHPAGKGRLGVLRRFPRGPVLAITPFNFPANLVMHKLAPAIAVGAPTVIKPASATPLSALTLGELALEAGWPPRFLSVLPMPGARAEAMVADERFGVLTFTGSQEVGWGLKARAGRKQVCLELGGNAAVIVHSDADVEHAAARVAAGAFGVAGQSCISVQRVYVHRPVFDCFAGLVVTRARELVVGHPLNEKADIGSLIDEPAARRIETWVDEAKARGARVLYGGRRDGARYAPTVVTACPPDARLAAAEAFAPVVVVEPYEAFEEAVARADDSRYGLQAGVFTRDWGRIRWAWERIRVGGLVAGDVPTWRADNMPYGGAKESGVGREGPRWAMEEYTEPRLLVIGEM
jgi:acyl-CoA reductase-like NAD-dependent aldehyde dehydrogenase